MSGARLKTERERVIRLRNRALFAVLAALAMLLYAVTLARIGG
ncbi:MAG TPA: hypothetical protein VFQ82_04890 [Stellaceae bacterium]|nr:hypothetical protein [Stellaceae bacterium]HEU0218482.1 hypothetical protein [Stellaceae bacterium]